MSSLFRVERSVLRDAQNNFSATDKILYHLDDLLVMMSNDNSSEAIVRDKFMVTKYDLKNTDIIGFKLEQCTRINCKVSVLTNGTNISEVANDDNFNMALLLSEELRLQVQENEDAVHLIASIFFGDDFFNDESGSYNTSKICGVLLPGLMEPLRSGISLIYNIGKYHTFDNNSCAFWNYLTKEEKLIKGSWKEDIDPQNNGRMVICEFQHLTHFVLLLANSNNILSENTAIHIWDIITNINSVLSLFGLFGILLTALLFDRWRNNTGNQILMNFSVAISIKNIMLYISVGVWKDNASGIACTITGGILHYSILSEFCWMLIIAILQFKRFVEVLGGPLKYVLLKACICGWVFPSFPVFLIIIIDVHNYSQGALGLCYPSGLGLYLAVWLPLIIIITINTIIFSFIVYNVFCNKNVPGDQGNHDMLFQWRLAILLFSMLGLTWIFGFIGLIAGVSMFSYIFCFFATLQGFTMFLFFIVFNKSTRYLYIQGLRYWLYSKGYKTHYT
ncbi:hypothetical protein JTB14_011791 [Gonioctena quinquepunctata]|nr:hypothetical protein JTB14_011791 [Gonioctena quinquepunctata]